jgi:hypothetical protein
MGAEEKKKRKANGAGERGAEGNQASRINGKGWGDGEREAEYSVYPGG